MKLLTSIPARKDGTVVAHHAGVNYTFKADDNGDLVGEVDSPEALALLLGTGNFIPYDEADMAHAVSLVHGDDEGDDEGDLDEDGDEAIEGGLPIEAGTPPAAKKGKGRKAA